MWTMSNIFMHGILYQVLLRSESASTWAKYYTRLHYMFGASSLSGRASWVSMIVMGLCVIPMVRRKYYKVRFAANGCGWFSARVIFWDFPLQCFAGARPGLWVLLRF